MAGTGNDCEAELVATKRYRVDPKYHVVTPPGTTGWYPQIIATAQLNQSETNGESIGTGHALKTGNANRNYPMLTLYLDRDTYQEIMHSYPKALIESFNLQVYSIGGERSSAVPSV